MNTNDYNLIHTYENGALLYQGSNHSIPCDWDNNPEIFNLIIYTARDKPPLNHHVGKLLEYYPFRDIFLRTPEEKEKTLEAALKSLPLIVGAIKKGKKVLITCNQGINRSGLVTALSLEKTTRLSKEEIIPLIKEKRLGALSNKSFVELFLSGIDNG